MHEAEPVQENRKVAKGAQTVVIIEELASVSEEF